MLVVAGLVTGSGCGQSGRWLSGMATAGGNDIRLRSNENSITGCKQYRQLRIGSDHPLDSKHWSGPVELTIY